MKITLFGATGRIGERILLEALSRGHKVTAVLRDPGKLELKRQGLSLLQGDALDLENVAAAVAGHDAVISAIGPHPTDDPRMVVEAAKTLLDGARKTRVRRILIVGGAGSLEVKPGLQLMDVPEFPADWKPVALAHREVLALFRAAKDIDWTYLSPAAFIEPGERTGRWRTGTDRLLADAKSQSRISMEDFAAALINELEHPAHLNRRMTVAY